jgi:hypothetical protein
MKKKSKGLNTMTSAIILSICLGLSMMVNGFFFWYNRQLLSRIAFISNNIDDLMKMITNYRDHLVSVYNMEMFYGDETLKFLMSHTRDLKQMLEEYEDVLYITEPIEEIEVVDDQQEEETNGPPQVEEENVFYAGARRRDS